MQVTQNIEYIVLAKFVFAAITVHCDSTATACQLMIYSQKSFLL